MTRHYIFRVRFFTRLFKRVPEVFVYTAMFYVLLIAFALCLIGALPNHYI